MTVPALLVPAAIDGLLAVWRAAFADEATVQVLDGHEVTWVAGDYVSAGVGGDDAVSEAVSQWSDMGGGRADAVDIANAVWSAGGDTDLRIYRDRAAALLRVAREAVEADLTLGGAVTQAQIVGYVYRPLRAPKGAGTAFEFTVRATFL